MRTYAQKPKATQQTKSAKSTNHGQAIIKRSHDVHFLLHLQRTIGNQAVQRLLQATTEESKANSATTTPSPRFSHDFSQISLHLRAHTTIQPKVTVSTPGDIYEQEANRVADQVMHMPEPGLHQACACGEGCPKCQPKQLGQECEFLQAGRTDANSAKEVVAPRIVNDVLRSTGEPLDSTIRGSMESRFGYDFSMVRLHTDLRAVESARALGARAYTVGRDVVFGAREYAPNRREGRRFLAHELTHVVQQGGVAQEKIQRQTRRVYSWSELQGMRLEDLFRLYRERSQNPARLQHVIRRKLDWKVAHGLTRHLEYWLVHNLDVQADEWLTRAIRYRLRQAAEQEVERAQGSTDRESAREIYTRWLNHWIVEERAAFRIRRDLEESLRTNDRDYAENRWLFDNGRREALGSEYERVANRHDTARFVTSDLEGVLNWLEAWVDVGGHRVTLAEVNRKALEIASAKAWFQTYMAPIILGVLYRGSLRARGTPPQPSAAQRFATAERYVASRIRHLRQRISRALERGRRAPASAEVRAKRVERTQSELAQVHQATLRNVDAIRRGALPEFRDLTQAQRNNLAGRLRDEVGATYREAQATARRRGASVPEPVDPPGGRGGSRPRRGRTPPRTPFDDPEWF